MGRFGLFLVIVAFLAAGAAIVTKPDADSFGPPMMTAIAEQSGATSPDDLSIQSCSADPRECAVGLRQYESAVFEEHDYVVARTAAVTWDDGPDARCVGAFGKWWCSTSGG